MVSILVTVDGSKESLEVLPAVEKIATVGDSTIQLFTVTNRPPSTSRGATNVSTLGPMAGIPAVPGGVTMGPSIGRAEQGWNETDDQAMERIIGEARSGLEELAAPLREKGFNVVTEVAVNNNASSAIIAHAKANSFDVIAMATHGRTGFRELVQGSVASAVVRAGVAPILLVRPSGTR